MGVYLAAGERNSVENPGRDESLAISGDGTSRELARAERKPADDGAPCRPAAASYVVYVIEGSGVLHLGDRQTWVSSGASIHLPPLELHCLENTGDEPIRMLGVFHSSGEPASRAQKINNQEPPPS